MARTTIDAPYLWMIGMILEWWRVYHGTPPMYQLMHTDPPQPINQWLLICVFCHLQLMLILVADNSNLYMLFVVHYIHSL